MPPIVATNHNIICFDEAYLKHLISLAFLPALACSSNFN